VEKFYSYPLYSSGLIQAEMKPLFKGKEGATTGPNSEKTKGSVSLLEREWFREFYRGGWESPPVIELTQSKLES
jgi:hypothetical protein